MNNKAFTVILLCFIALILKSFIGGMGLAEALSSIGCVAYLAFQRYTEWRKAKDLDESYEERLRNLEQKLMFLSSGSIINQKRR